MTVAANTLLGVVLAVCAFVWAVAAIIDVGIFVVRCSGSSKSSAVPGVAALTGLAAAAILREWFEWIESPLVYLVAITPDLLYAAGELLLWLRMRALGWPDKRASRAEPS
jgi:hypothetical protein